MTFRHCGKCVQIIETTMGNNRSSRQWVNKTDYTLACGDQGSKTVRWMGTPRRQGALEGGTVVSSHCQDQGTTKACKPMFVQQLSNSSQALLFHCFLLLLTVPPPPPATTTNNTLEKVTFHEVQNKQRKETFWKTCRIETLLPVATMNVEQGISTGMYVLQIGPNQHFWWNYCVNIYIYCTSFSALVLKYDYQEEVCFNLL